MKEHLLQITKQTQIHANPIFGKAGELSVQNSIAFVQSIKGISRLRKFLQFTHSRKFLSTFAHSRNLKSPFMHSPQPLGEPLILYNSQLQG